MASKKIVENTHEKLLTDHFGISDGEKDKSENNRDRVICTSAGDD
jgi:hypothetical protein